MKKRLSILLATLILTLPSIGAASTLDDATALLGELSYDELVTLRNSIDAAIWQSDTWQEVTVPAGVYEVGLEIPAGHWNISPVGDSASIRYSRNLAPDGNSVDYASDWYHECVETDSANGYPASVNLYLEAGRYLDCRGDVIFKPYFGKGDFGFKKD